MTSLFGLTCELLPLTRGFTHSEFLLKFEGFLQWYSQEFLCHKLPFFNICAGRKFLFVVQNGKLSCFLCLPFLSTKLSHNRSRALGSPFFHLILWPLAFLRLTLQSLRNAQKLLVAHFTHAHALFSPNCCDFVCACKNAELVSMTHDSLED